MMARELPANFDPFAPVSAKPKDEAERHKRRVHEAASAGGKAHRGHGHDPSKVKFSRPTRFRKRKVKQDGL